MKRRAYLRGIATSAGVLGVVGVGSAGESGASEVDGWARFERVEVLRGTPGSPVTSDDVERANERVLGVRSGGAATDGTGGEKQVVPVPRAPDDRTVVSYMVGTTATGQVRYFHGTLPSEISDVGAARQNQRKMDEYVGRFAVTGSAPPDSATTRPACSDGLIPSGAQMAPSEEGVGGFGCPQVGGRRVDEGHPDGDDSYEDSAPAGEVTVEEKFYGKYLAVTDDEGDVDPERTDQWCGALTTVRVNPGSVLTGSDAKDEFVLGYNHTTHDWDRSASGSSGSGTDGRPEAVYGTTQNPTNRSITPVGVSVGAERFGFGVGWTPGETEVETSIDSSRARWAVNYTGDRDRTAHHTWASVCRYDSEVPDGDEVLTSRVDTQFEDRFGPVPIAFANSHTEVDYLSTEDSRDRTSARSP